MFKLQKEGIKLSNDLTFSYSQYFGYFSFTYMYKHLERDYGFLRCYICYFN